MQTAVYKNSMFTKERLDWANSMISKGVALHDAAKELNLHPNSLQSYLSQYRRGVYNPQSRPDLPLRNDKQKKESFDQIKARIKARLELNKATNTNATESDKIINDIKQIVNSTLENRIKLLAIKSVIGGFL